MVCGWAEAEAHVAIGTPANVDPPSPDDQTLAVLTGAPAAGDVMSLIGSSSAVSGAFADRPTFIGLGQLETQHSYGADSLSETSTTSAVLQADPTQIASPGDLILGLFAPAVAYGANISDVHLTVIAGSLPGIDVDFSNAADAQAYFSDHAIDLGSLGGTTTSLHIEIALSVTATGSGSGFTSNFVLGSAH